MRYKSPGQRLICKIVAGAVLIFQVQMALGQNYQLIDSLKESLRSAEAQNRFQLLSSIAWEYRFGFPDTTIYYARQAFDLGRELQVHKDLAKPLNYIGIAYNYRGDRLLSLSYLQQAIDLAIQQNDSSQLAHAYNSMGRVYYGQGMVQRSVDYFIKSEKIFQTIHDLHGIAYAYQSLGNLYHTQSDFNNAFDLYSRALKIREQIGNKREIISAYIFLGRLYQDERKFAESNEYFFAAGSMAQEINDAILRAEIEIYQAQNYLESGNISKAETIGIKSFNEITAINNVRMLPLASLVIGRIYSKQNHEDKASQYFFKSREAATLIRDAGALRDAYYWLWKLEEKRGNATAAIRYQNQFLIMRDSTRDFELTRKVDRLQFQMELEKREHEKELLKVERELLTAEKEKNNALILQQRGHIYMLILAAASGCGIIAILLISGSKRKKLNGQLVTHNAEMALKNLQLRELNSQKDMFTNIVAHDLKSPLNSIKALCFLLEMQGNLDQEQLKYVKLIKDSTQSGTEIITDLLSIHELESNISLVIEQVALEAFICNRLNTFAQAATEKNISFETTITEGSVYTDKMHLSRVLDNLISNAIKFSPPGSTIFLEAKHLEEYVEISVRDQGPGFSEEDKKHLYQKFKKLSARPTGGESSSGLGLAIVKILVDSLSGRIDLKSEAGQGSEFIVTIPVKRKL